MNKLVKTTIACCVSGAALICGGANCFAEEADNSSKQDSIMGMISDTVSSLLQDEKVNQVVQNVMNSEAVQDVMNSEEVQKVTEYAAQAWNMLAEEEREGIASYFQGMFADEFGIRDESPLTEDEFEGMENSDNVQVLTAEEAAALDFAVYPVEGMTVSEYIMSEDPIYGEKYVATLSTGDTYYTLTRTSANAVTDSDIENEFSALSMIDPDNASTATVKVGDFDAQVTMIPTMGYCSVDWIDTDNGQHYNFTSIMLGNDTQDDLSPESMGELAAHILNY